MALLKDKNMNKKTAQSPRCDCEACKNNRRVLEPGCEHQDQCMPLKDRLCILETPLEIVKEPQLRDYTELIW